MRELVELTSEELRLVSGGFSVKVSRGGNANGGNANGGYIAAGNGGNANGGNANGGYIAAGNGGAGKNSGALNANGGTGGTG
jgi:hypothetical protein